MLNLNVKQNPKINKNLKNAIIMSNISVNKFVIKMINIHDAQNMLFIYLLCLSMTCLVLN